MTKFSTGIVVTILLTFASTSTALAEDDALFTSDFAGLDKEQEALARRSLEFLSRINNMYFSRIDKMNGGSEKESRFRSTEYADYNAKAARGPVIQKGGRLYSITKKPTRSFQKQTIWSRFFSVNMHAKSPYVGMVHNAFVIQFYEDGGSSIGGFLDVLPGATPEEDLLYIKERMDAVYEKHGVDPGPYRALSCKGDDEAAAATNKTYRRKVACIGGSFYLQPMLKVTEANFDFMTEAYETFLDSYLTMAEKHIDDPYTDKELALQDAMRLNWFEDRFFSDPFTRDVVPYEIWSLHSLPPVVKF
ncbi:MAG: coproporphyrinogen III oxidase [Gammaproteobacteria bacterium]